MPNLTIGVLALQGDRIDPLVQEDRTAEARVEVHGVWQHDDSCHEGPASFESELVSRYTLATLLATKHTREGGANPATGATPK